MRWLVETKWRRDQMKELAIGSGREHVLYELSLFEDDVGKWIRQTR